MKKCICFHEIPLHERCSINFWPNDENRIDGSSAVQPNDFALVPHIKKKMRGQRFSSAEDWTVGVFQNNVLEVSQSELEKKHK